jgi:hypothetical protein
MLNWEEMWKEAVVICVVSLSRIWQLFQIQNAGVLFHSVCVSRSHLVLEYFCGYTHLACYCIEISHTEGGAKAEDA